MHYGTNSKGLNYYYVTVCNSREVIVSNRRPYFVKMKMFLYNNYLNMNMMCLVAYRG